MEVEKNGIKICELCTGVCPKACRGTKVGSQYETVDSRNIDSFINCTKILGNLDFLVTGINGDEWRQTTPLNPEKLRVFETVREITGYLNIQAWPENMTDFNVFSNLTTIGGRTQYQRGFSLLIMKNSNVTSLGFHSLKEISAGNVYISDNPQLCFYPTTINWKLLFSFRRQRTDIKNNRSLKKCVAEGKVCDPLCSSTGCWGPGPDQCISCKNYSRKGTCVQSCHFFEGDYREYSEESRCLSCHPECQAIKDGKTCNGSGPDHCVKCAHYKDGPHCVETCPEGIMGKRGLIFKYPDPNGVCQPCHENCTQGCKGPSASDCTLYPPWMASSSALHDSKTSTIIAAAVVGGLFVTTSSFLLALLYWRGLMIRKKRAMRRYLENIENHEPMEPGEKANKVHARKLKETELRKLKILGSGVFGTVYKGIWIPEGDSVKIPVAIKAIQDRTGRQTFHNITEPLQAMGCLEHPHVLRLLGICPGAGLQLVTQLMPMGSLLEYIRKHQDKVNPQLLLNWCIQIAKGMYYLEEHRMVHRNLAARNVMMKSPNLVQVADFGIADLLYPDDKKYLYNEIKTPIKWMALESIHFRRYTHQSDVWSYGVTIWEMMTFGSEPYAGIRLQEVPDLLEKGERLSQPPICTIDVYMVMVKCWMIDENIRPTFKELASEFTRMARDPPRYLVVKESGTISSSLADQPHLGENDPDDVDGLDPESDLEETDMNSQLNISMSLLVSRQRIDSARNQNLLLPPTGYMPMGANGSEESRQNTLRSVDLGSRRTLRMRNESMTRTVSESSEGHGTLSEMDPNDDLSLSGTLHCGQRKREDSAYLSNRASMTTPSVFGDTEEDVNGYVIPNQNSKEGSKSMSGMDSRSEMLNQLSNQASPSTSKFMEGQEYEYMNKRSSKSSSPESTEETHKGESGLKGSEQQAYEHMDTSLIRTPHSPQDQDTPKQEEEEDYEYMNKQPILCKSLNGDKIHKYQSVPQQPTEDNYFYTNRDPDEKESGKLIPNTVLLDASTVLDQQEYEIMDTVASQLDSAEQGLEYQNLPSPRKGQAHQNGYVKVGRAVPSLEDSTDCAFDNPDYWHSRLFTRSDAQRV
nr:PREDICTED: receptor tyrosine-protein kinase erbB-3 [Latimeria chalumnae]|eukprot:XP_014354429.1 PREDICTED: receptor tyrosine-protein kinase erbB-3 [Latimeria chalumnae]